MTDEQRLRAASWREITDRPVTINGAIPRSAGDWMSDAQEALNEATAALPLTELGELLIEMYDKDPVFWRNHLPIVVVAKIDYIKEAR